MFLGALEAERKGLIGSTEDTVSILWRCDLRGITFAAIDGLGDQEGDGTGTSAKNEYGALVADLMSKIQNPAPPETGQRYAFMLDLDAEGRVSESDLHYEATTQHRSFEENPTVLELTSEEVKALRAEVTEQEGIGICYPQKSQGRCREGLGNVEIGAEISCLSSVGHRKSRLRPKRGKKRC